MRTDETVREVSHQQLFQHRIQCRQHFERGFRDFFSPSPLAAPQRRCADGALAAAGSAGPSWWRVVAQGPVSAEAEGHARQVVLWAILHTADLSNPARPLPLGAEWGHLVAREFLAQVAAIPLLSSYSFTAP